MKFRLIHGECIKVMKKLPSDSVDMILTSPPYDNLRTYKNTLDWNFEIFKEIALQLKRLLRPGGVIVWVVGDATIKGSETGTSFKQALYFKEIGLNLHDTMIYQKDNCPFPQSNRYYPNFEYMFIFSNGDIKVFNPIKDRINKSFGRNITGTNRQRNGETIAIKNKDKKIKKFGVRFNVWLVSEDLRQKQHPATFPEKLAYGHILSWSNEGDTILDPMMGSGTTGKQCKLLKRNFIGIEVVKEYFDISVKRIKAVKKEKNNG